MLISHASVNHSVSSRNNPWRKCKLDTCCFFMYQNFGVSSHIALENIHEESCEK